MVPDKNAVLERLCREIAMIARREPGEIQKEESLRNNGIDSMSFLELLLFIKKEWNIDYLEIGLPPDAQGSISALAEHICNDQAGK